MYLAGERRVPEKVRAEQYGRMSRAGLMVLPGWTTWASSEDVQLFAYSAKDAHLLSLQGKHTHKPSYFTSLPRAQLTTKRKGTGRGGKGVEDRKPKALQVGM